MNHTKALCFSLVYQIGVGLIMPTYSIGAHALVVVSGIFLYFGLRIND